MVLKFSENRPIYYVNHLAVRLPAVLALFDPIIRPVYVAKRHPYGTMMDVVSRFTFHLRHGIVPSNLFLIGSEKRIEMWARKLGIILITRELLLPNLDVNPAVTITVIEAYSGSCIQTIHLGFEGQMHLTVFCQLVDDEPQYSLVNLTRNLAPRIISRESTA